MQVHLQQQFAQSSKAGLFAALLTQAKICFYQMVKLPAILDLSREQT
jgi:hypothetical protein